MGQAQARRDGIAMSVFRPKADLCRNGGDVRFVPMIHGPWIGIKLIKASDKEVNSIF
jgi:hypothetical protein